MKESSFCFATATLLRARRKIMPTSACTGHGEKTARNRTRPTLGYQRRCTRQDFNEPWLEIGFRTDWRLADSRLPDWVCDGVIMLFNGFLTASPGSRYPPPRSSDSNNHHRMDERRGCCIPLGSVDGSQPRPAGFRW